ncbi:hypothetical protein CEXT_752721 [Caerostris extrusa]|uniref:Uncharacterized protein n=1 Tax=Caerostris extrusa TaxID=172846 RepID=A0AAV4WWS2_CAEEX|nr:hypothetical protein CEXT_752721 [Caerostris extrusa]
MRGKKEDEEKIAAESKVTSAKRRQLVLVGQWSGEMHGISKVLSKYWSEVYIQIEIFRRKCFRRLGYNLFLVFSLDARNKND